MRSALLEFFECLPENVESYSGVVHSFTGSVSDLKEILSKTPFYIGINGCSLKTEENLKMAREIPLEKLLLETDCPWCGIKNTHASKKYVKTEFPVSKKFKQNHTIKDRSEPCHIINVAEVMSELKNVSLEELTKICYDNTKKLFKIF